jgi:DNA-binding transcriptional regulator LsrR (DeoR family)
VYENPGIPQYEIAQHTRIPRSSVSRYLAEMYALSVLKGPMIFMKISQIIKEFSHVVALFHVQH